MAPGSEDKPQTPTTLVDRIVNAMGKDDVGVLDALIVEVGEGTDMDFCPIYDEQDRTYTFPGGDKITIYTPLCMFVSASGGHRVVDSQGDSHYIPSGWIHLTWHSYRKPFAF